MQVYNTRFIHKFSNISILLTLLFSVQLMAAIQEQKLIASDGAMDDLFGGSVSISGDYAVVGANQVKINEDQYGAAYVFKYDGSQWQEVVKLTPTQAFENFGASVSISGDTIAIGAPNANADNPLQPGNEPQAGVVYLYKRDVNNAWNETHRLFPADVDGYDKFGSSISLENNQLIVGSPFDDDIVSGSGSAYIFDFDGNDWIETDKLTASNPAASDKFGFKVDINGSRAVVSSPNSDDVPVGDSVGSVYVFEKVVTDWNETKILQASDMAEDDNFGIDISLSGNRILVGAFGNDDTVLNSGSAYIFEYNTNNMTWDTGLKLNANDPGANDRYGGAVKIEGDRILIGAVSNDDGNALGSGSVYSFHYTGISWEFVELILHSDTPTRFTDAFGNAIDLENDRAIFGSYFDDGLEYQTFNSGAAYIFDVDVKPLAVLDTITIDEDELSVNFNVLFNDTDPDGGTKIITAITQPNNGQATVNNNNTTIIYSPNLNYCNDGTTTDDFSYTLNGGSTTNVEVTVTCIDDLPIAINNYIEIFEDLDFVTIEVINNDTDVDGGPLFVESFTQPDNGLVVAFGAHLNYTPNTNYCSENADEFTNNRRGETNTSDVFNYTLNGGSTATVGIFVNCVDDIPVAVLDAISVNEDQGSSQLNVLDNDTDVDDGTITIVDFTQPSHGTVINNSNNMTYTPHSDYCNSGSTADSFTYTLNGGNLATVNITVNCVNDAPSFSIIGDINLDPSQLNNQNQLIVENFTNNIVFGPDNESSQQVLQFNIQESSDTSNVISNLSIDNNGTLTLDFTINTGVAMINISLQDDGGIANNGEDTSAELMFNVVFPDAIFENSFEEPELFRVVDYLNKVSLALNLFEWPVYDYESDSLLYKGFMLELNSSENSSIIKFKILYWIKEIESYMNHN